MTVLRRLDCVLELTKDKVLEEHKALKARRLDDATIEKTIRHKFKLPFFNTSKYTFQKLIGDPDGIAHNLVAYMKGFLEAGAGYPRAFRVRAGNRETGQGQPPV